MGMMDDFEKASDNLNKNNYNSDVEIENVIEWLRDSDTATVCFSQKRMITKIKRLAEKFPDEVQIVAENKTSIVAHIPVKAIKINLPKREEMTSEQKIKAIERLKRAREISK